MSSPTSAQLTAECQLIWFPGESWLQRVEVTSVEEGHDVGCITFYAPDDVGYGGRT